MLPSSLELGHSIPLGTDAVKHALIIEDNHLIAMMVEEELAELGYGLIETATSQRQAIEMAIARCPDLITVDDKLDSGTGVDTILEICRHQAIPVVFISADPEAIEKSISDAIVIRKPFSNVQLTAAIEAAISAPLTLNEHTDLSS
jgi:DNA-binding response OmpR family regulator